MALVDFSDSDLLRNKILPPAWYEVSIEKVADWTVSSKGTSNNCLMDCVVLRNADTNETDGIAGVPVYIQLNDSPKARGFIQAFLCGLGVDVESGVRYDLKAAEGKSIIAFIENETWEGRVRNRINHKYRIPKAE